MSCSERVYAEDEYIPLSALQHYIFCPRQCGLIHLEQTWGENRLTAEGELLHQRVHQEGVASRGGVLSERSVRLSSAGHGICGIADSVEYIAAKESEKPFAVQLGRVSGWWRVYPVEYKHGRKKADMSDAVQLCAQAFCLESMHEVQIADGAIFYGKSQSRVPVEFTAALRNETARVIREVRALFADKLLPPAEYGAKCRNCSLSESCMPEIISSPKASTYVAGCLAEIREENSGATP